MQDLVSSICQPSPHSNDFPSPLEGEGGSRVKRDTDEGDMATSLVFQTQSVSSNPSSGAARHLLPQGEKAALGLLP